MQHQVETGQRARVLQISDENAVYGSSCPVRRVLLPHVYDCHEVTLNAALAARTSRRYRHLLYDRRRLIGGSSDVTGDDTGDSMIDTLFIMD